MHMSFLWIKRYQGFHDLINDIVMVPGYTQHKLNQYYYQHMHSSIHIKNKMCFLQLIPLIKKDDIVTRKSKRCLRNILRLALLTFTPS